MSSLSSRGSRALRQSMFLLNAIQFENDDWTFEVQGSMGTNYLLSFSKTCINCNCPDFTKRQETCKHCFFIVGRVLNDLELMKKMEDGCEPSQLFLANFSGRMQKRIEQRTFSIASSCTDDCVVCFEPIDAKVGIWECKGCKKGCMHDECARRWLEKKNSCPLCRNPASPITHDPLLVFRQKR